LQQAEAYRAAIAKEWLGETLPPSIGRTVINISFSATEDRGLTWAKDDPRRKFHNIYLTTAPELVLGDKLRHEIVHVVLATRYAHPNRLPPWVEEGIASRYDDEQRIATRRGILSWYVRTGNLPDISRVLDAPNLPPSDQTAYAVAASLTDYLLSLHGKEVLLKFAQASKKDGLDAALLRHYRIESIQHLQSQWAAQLERTQHVTVHQPTRLR
jgi:hypothetical protein